MGEGTEWIEVRRFNDFVEAQLVEQFLRDHGLRVRRTGNGTMPMALDRFTSVIDIRLLVPIDSVDEAREALEAMATEVQDAPYRGQAPAPEQIEDPEESKDPARNPRAAFMLALLVPIGGGHFYARSNATGVLLALGVLAGFGVAIVLGMPALMFGALLIIPLDAIGAYFAARRFNAGRAWSPGKQRAWGAGAVVLAFGAASGWSYVDALGGDGRNLRWQPLGTHDCGSHVAGCAEQCDKGNAPSCHAFAQNLVVEGVRDERRAVPPLERACKVDYWPSCVLLGRLSSESDVVPQDLPRSVALFRRACDASIAEGCLRLGLLYRDAPKLVADPDDAWRAFNRGCKLGDSRACDELRASSTTPRQ